MGFSSLKCNRALFIYPNRNSQEEAIEEHEIVEEDDKSASSEGEGDDLMNNIEDDYKAVPELDEYEAEGIDEEDVDEIDPEARHLADRELDEREYAR